MPISRLAYLALTNVCANDEDRKMFIGGLNWETTDGNFNSMDLALHL